MRPPAYLSQSSYRLAVKAAIERGDFADALIDLALKAEQVKNEPLATGRIFGSRTLDELCTLLGRRYMQSLELAAAADAASEPTTVYVCTETYGTGGHARVIADLIRADRSRRHHVVFTNLWERERLFTAEFDRLGARVTILPKALPLEKLRQLLILLHTMDGARLMLFNHHQDSIAVAGVAAVPQADRFFIHHCDYQFCLGPFLPDTRHVDLHAIGYQRCRQHVGIRDSLYWPLTCDADGGTHSQSFMSSGSLTTCCCGSENKFVGPYPIDYFECMAERLGTIPGKHVHMGPIGTDRLQRLRQSLATRGISPDRFVHLPHVPNLRQALLDHKVDIYLVSFPFGGGRAVIEAMAAGVPVVGHLHHRDKILSGPDFLPAESPLWTDVPELLTILAAMTPDRLRLLSGAALQRFDRHHHPRLLAACVPAGSGLEPPAETCNDVDPLQTFLFEKAFLAPRTQHESNAIGASRWRLPV